MRLKHLLMVLTILSVLWAAVSDLQAAWRVNGSAYVPGTDSDHIVITPELNDRAGSAWLDFPLNLNLDFDLTLAVNMGTRDADGADGMAIVLHNDPAGDSGPGRYLSRRRMDRPARYRKRAGRRD